MTKQLCTVEKGNIYRHAFWKHALNAFGISTKVSSVPPKPKNPNPSLLKHPHFKTMQE